ncbi:MAG: hypothetical protein E6I80_02450 [Chloroflexi bacterium]|nr:MAG: hypothetical protein E6I80_02450 [Chloroflexota bacterium]
MTEPTQDSNSKLTPYLRKQESATQLVVDGKPFLVLGGELHNSSSSSLEYMRPISRSGRRCWPTIRKRTR